MTDSLDYVTITNEKLDMDMLVAFVSCEEAGAISTFIGTTRNHFNGKKVKKLEYEAYSEMARKEWLKICKTLHSRWNIYKTAMAHRTGEVPVGDASVIIAVSSCHRKDSLEAVQYAIDELKATVPIWKKEYYEDGSVSWKENAECCFPKTHHDH